MHSFSLIVNIITGLTWISSLRLLQIIHFYEMKWNFFPRSQFHRISHIYHPSHLNISILLGHFPIKLNSKNKYYVIYGGRVHVAKMLAVKLWNERIESGEKWRRKRHHTYTHTHSLAHTHTKAVIIRPAKEAKTFKWHTNGSLTIACHCQIAWQKVMKPFSALPHTNNPPPLHLHSFCRYFPSRTCMQNAFCT